MTVKEYLSQAFEIDKMLRAKQEQIQRLKDVQAFVGSVMTDIKVRSSGSHDRLGDATADLLDTIQEYANDLQKLLDIKSEIKQLIDSQDNQKYRLILTERYINLKRWEDIASDNCYSWSWMHELHGKALKRIETDYRNVV